MVMLHEITINFTIKNVLVFVPFMAMIKLLIWESNGHFMVSAFNSFFMAMKKHLIFMSGDSKFLAFLMVYFNAFFMEWNFSWPRKKSWKVQKLMATIF